MPNTPCVVGEMAAGYCVAPSPENVDLPYDDSTVVHALLSACGTAVETEERLMDAVTGVSGSGPVRTLSKPACFAFNAPFSIEWIFYATRKS